MTNGIIDISLFKSVDIHVGKHREDYMKGYPFRKTYGRLHSPVFF